MLTTILALLLTTALCFSFGLLLIKCIQLFSGKNSVGQVEPTVIIWLGLGLISWILMICNLWLKIGWAVFIFVFGVAILSNFWLKGEIKNLIKPQDWLKKKNLFLIIVTLVYVLFILAKSTSPVFSYDSGLYHIQSIKWIESYPIIPGLGNLHGRFAFNSNWFLVSALFGFNYLFSQRIFVLNILIFCLGLLFLSRRISNLGETKKLSNVLALLIYLSIIMIHAFVNSPTTDLPSDLLIWFTLILFIEKYEDKTLSLWNLNSWMILFLALFAVSIKFSTAPVLLLPFSLLIFASRNTRQPLWQALLLSLVFLLPWFIRTIILAGTIIYPVSFLQLPWLDWSIPPAQISSMSQSIHDWAVLPGPLTGTIKTMSITQWIFPWLRRMAFFLGFILMAFLGNILLFINDIKRILRGRDFNPNTLFFLSLDIYLLVSLLFWFIGAPDPRFAYGLIMAGFWISLTRFTFPLQARRIYTDSILIAILVLVSFLFSMLVKEPSFTQSLLLPPKVPIAQTEKISINSDHFVLTPSQSDQCWDEDLPCIVSLNPGLAMRGTDFSDGFKILPEE